MLFGVFSHHFTRKLTNHSPGGDLPLAVASRDGIIIWTNKPLSQTVYASGESSELAPGPGLVQIIGGYRKKVPKIIRLIRQAKGLNADPNDDSILDKLTPNVPGIVTFADHSRKLPWCTDYLTVVMFADISGFTALCERYSSMQDSGIDKLTKTLNAYLGAIVQNITCSEGDVLKFAGDAILAVWRVNSPVEMTAIIDKVVQCCIDIQKEYGEWKTDIGITLTVKMGVSAGHMKVTFIGNDEFRVYVETGQAVSDVNVAESFCQSGFIVLSPDAWNQATQYLFEVEMLHDDNHVRVLSRKSPAMKGSIGMKGFRSAGYAAVFAAGRRPSLPPTSTSSVPTAAIPSSASIPDERLLSEPAKPKISKLSKLRSVVKTVTELRLDEALRLFILPPVLKKIDDFQPLEYLSEMRQVSIVFINLVLDKDQDETKLLQKIFEVVYRDTKAMNGCLNKVFLFDKGCTFLVIFGLPGFKQDQDCAHALMCSYRMKSRLDILKGVIHISIGVTTGTTFCGVIGHSKRHEYSVIGRKVNMAARLMMHYPDKVTCDDNTFQLSRLPGHNFDVLITKRMKGLRNVGIIREFTEGDDSLDSGINSVPYFSYPLLGCAKETEMFEEQMKTLKNESDSNIQLQHLVYVGASGIGKTRLLDHLIIHSEEKNLRVMSCAVKMNDRFNPNFLTRHILRMLITSAGFSQHIDREPQIIEKLSSKGLLGSLSLTPQLLGIQLSTSNMFYKYEDISSERLGQAHELICTIAEVCVTASSPVVIALDDAQNIDAESWKTLYSLIQTQNILLILTIRPTAVEEPSCPEASKFLNSSNVYIEDISGIENKYLTALACQLMDVVRIPIPLQRLLKERCHGVPYWCEQVLIDMVEKRQLMILETDIESKMEEDMIAPDYNHIKNMKYRNIQGAEEDYKKCNDVFLTVTAVETIGSSNEPPRSHNFLKDLGYVHKETGQRGIKQRIAIFSPHVDPENIPVPDIMKNLITAKIDSMRATEQLIVKCAAILGETFSRDMIESILPNVNRVKARKSFNVLRKTGIFECANMYNPHYSQFSKAKDEKTEMDCCCPPEDDVVDKDLCNLMKFTNLILMDTCYKILMESQRKNLHASAADYLDRKADQIRKGVPYYTLERAPPFLDLVVKDRNYSRRRSSNKVEDIAIAKAESYIRRRGRKKAIQIHDVGMILPTLLQSLKSERTIEQACQCLMPMYSQIQHHRTATKDYMKIIDILVEEAAACIVLKESHKAMKILQDAEEWIYTMIDEKGQDEDDESLNVLYAKLARMTGKALCLSNEKEEAFLYMKHAAKLLRMSEPEGRCNMYTQYLYSWIFVRILRNSSKTRKLATERTVETGYCLAELYEFEKENGEELHVAINALRQMIKVTGRESNLHQKIQAYKVMIEFCNMFKHPKLKDNLEREFLAMCLARYEELQIDDLVVMSQICGDICIKSLERGNISRAISSGTSVVKIGETIKQTDIDKNVFPILALSLMFSDQREPCLEMIEQMKSYNEQKKSVVGQAWYHVINMEIMLCWNMSVESFEDILDFAGKLMSKPDALCNELLPRYMLAMSIAAWFCRHGQWSSAQIWFDYWELYDPEETTVLSVYALARKIEIMLMSFCISKKTKPKALWRVLQKAILKDIGKLASSVKKVVTLKPRYYHLKAYYFALIRRYCQSEIAIYTACKLSKELDNKLEHGWIKHHKKEWYRKAKRKGGKQSSGERTPEWYEMFDIENKGGYYTWPIKAF